MSLKRGTGWSKTVWFCTGGSSFKGEAVRSVVARDDSDAASVVSE